MVLALGSAYLALRYQPFHEAKRFIQEDNNKGTKECKTELDLSDTHRNSVLKNFDDTSIRIRFGFWEELIMM